MKMALKKKIEFWKIIPNLWKYLGANVGYALGYAVAQVCCNVLQCVAACCSVSWVTHLGTLLHECVSIFMHALICVYVCMNIHAHAHHTRIDEKRQGQSDRQAQECRCVSRPLVAPAIVTGYVSVSVLRLWQYVAVCCNVLQCGVVYCNVVE